ERAVYLVETARLRARLTRRGDRALSGDLEHADFYREALKGGRGPVVVAARATKLGRVVAAVGAAFPDTPVVVVRDDDRPMAGATTVSLASFGERVIQPALDRACQRARAERVRAHFEGADRILILMQDDPD